MTRKPANHEYRRTTGISLTAIVLPCTSEVLLGTFPLQGLDAFIDAKGERLLVHPESPDNPKSKIRALKRAA